MTNDQATEAIQFRLDTSFWEKNLTTWSGLNAIRVNSLASIFNDNDGFSVVWPNVLWTADQYWSAQAQGSESRSIETWHHLVMSAGNYKRQGGAQISLLRLPNSTWQKLEDQERPERCLVYTKSGSFYLNRDDEITWIRLQNEVSGLALATTTTLLSALWPGDHVIADVLDMSVAFALNLDEVTSFGWVQSEGKKPTPMNWDSYKWLRNLITAKSNELTSSTSVIEPIDIERALYRLGQRVNDARNGGNATWSDYAILVQSTLESL